MTKQQKLENIQDKLERLATELNSLAIDYNANYVDNKNKRAGKQAGWCAARLTRARQDVEGALGWIGDVLSC